MARLARVVVPGIPHHVIQRGNRRQETFFEDADYRAYMDLMAEWCERRGVEVWAYCLMPNHVHLICVPATADALGRAVGEAHRRYALRVNKREGWTGYLWQGRFASYPMDEAHLRAAARYVERNPVAAGLVRRARDWRWSSARAHLAGTDDRLVRTAPLLERVAAWGDGDWRSFLSGKQSDDDHALIERHGRTGRPLGDAKFLTTLERRLGRPLRKEKPGPKKGAKGVKGR